MKVQTLVLLTQVTVALAIAPAAAQAPPAAASETSKPGIIRGRITAADSGKPLRRARVSILPASGSSWSRPVLANTNASGQFEFKEIQPGSYYVGASRAGYLTVQFGQRRARELGLTVEVRSGRIAGDVDIALPRGGVLSGRITDELGEPYPGVRVDALGTHYDQGKRVPSPIGMATTDDLGQFRIAGLQPGDYYLVATSAETWRNEKKETYGYASTYFPGGAIDTAQLITLGPSEQHPDLSFSLHASRAVRITGVVRREDGEPARGAGVSLAYTYPGVTVVAGSRSVRTASDGSFEFKDVAPGVYGVFGGGGEQTVTVAGTDIDGIALVSKTGSTVSGTVASDDGTPLPFPTSGVRVALEAPVGNVLPTVRVVAVDTDWSFKLTGLGGPFLFLVTGAPEDWMVASVRLGDKDITDVPWDVPTGGKEIGGLKIVLTMKVGKLAGAVLDARGAPTSAATVVVFADDPERWLPGSRLIRVIRPGIDGRFSIAGLPAGAYRAIARDFIEEGQWEDRKFLEDAREGAARFELSQGGSETITLRLRAAK